MLKHAREVARVCKHLGAGVKTRLVIIFILLPKVVERIETGLGHLHADEDFVIGGILTLHILHFKKVVEDSSEGLHLIDCLEL